MLKYDRALRIRQGQITVQYNSGVLASRGESFARLTYSCSSELDEHPQPFRVYRRTGIHQLDLPVSGYYLVSLRLRPAYLLTCCREGLEDAKVHGQDVQGVYGELLQFLPLESERNKYQWRVTNNVGLF